MMLYITLIALSTALALAMTFTVHRVTRQRVQPSSGSAQPAVSVLKPLKGADDSLESNLETFFRQDYSGFELLFGVEGDTDPAIEVVERLRRRYPNVESRLIIHNGGRALNPKVSNLLAILEGGTHDVVVISDSNVSVDPGYLRNMVQTLQEPGVGLVSNLIAGVGERTPGATLENLQLNGAVAGGVAGAQELTGAPVVVGKSMMFRRSVIDTLGGLQAVANVLAEDYVLGQMFHQAGYHVRLASGVIRNVVANSTVKRFFDRQLRWAMLRWRLLPHLAPFEFVTTPIVLALLSPLFGVSGAWPLFWALGVTFLRDGVNWVRLRGSVRGLGYALPLALFKDLLMSLVLLVAPFRKHVGWRGNQLRISAGTRLYAETPSYHSDQMLLQR